MEYDFSDGMKDMHFLMVQLEPKNLINFVCTLKTICSRNLTTYKKWENVHDSYFTEKFNSSTQIGLEIM